MPDHPPRSFPHPSAGPAAAAPGVPISQFQRLIYDRYYKTDSQRGTAGTFLLFMEEVGELATALHDNRPAASDANPMGKKRPVSAEERANLEEEFADVLAWLATLANITGVDLETAVRKYMVPGVVEGVKE